MPTYVFTQSVGKECDSFSWLYLFIRLPPSFFTKAFLLPVWGFIPPLIVQNLSCCFPNKDVCLLDSCAKDHGGLCRQNVTSSIG